MSFLQCMLKFLLTPNIGILAVIKSANRWLSVNRYCKYGLKITLKTIRKYLIVVLNLNFTGKLFVVWCVYIYMYICKECTTPTCPTYNTAKECSENLNDEL